MLSEFLGELTGNPTWRVFAYIVFGDIRVVLA